MQSTSETMSLMQQPLVLQECASSASSLVQHRTRRLPQRAQVTSSPRWTLSHAHSSESSTSASDPLARRGGLCAMIRAGGAFRRVPSNRARHRRKPWPARCTRRRDFRCRSRECLASSAEPYPAKALRGILFGLDLQNNNPASGLVVRRGWTAHRRGSVLPCKGAGYVS